MRSPTLLVLLVALPAHASQPCGPPIPAFEILAPRPSEEGVPRNLSVSARNDRGVLGQGGSAEEVPDGAFVFVDTVDGSTLTGRTQVTASRTGGYLEIRPLQLLEARRRYELRSADSPSPATLLAFTTGDDEDHEPPPPPAVVRAEGIDLGACDTAGVELEIVPQAAGGARALFASQRNTLPFNEHLAPELGGDGAPIARLVVGGDAEVDGEVVAIDLAGNRSVAAAFSTTAGGGCACVAGAGGGGVVVVVMVMGLLSWRGRGRGRPRWPGSSPADQALAGLLTGRRRL